MKYMLFWNVKQAEMEYFTFGTSGNYQGRVRYSRDLISARLDWVTLGVL